MKKLTALLTAAVLLLTACSESAEVFTENRTAAPAETEVIEPEVIVAEGSVDYIRRASGMSDEFVIDDMIEHYIPFGGGCTPMSILVGEAVEIIYGEWHSGIIMGNLSDMQYRFRITDNLTGHDLPEYITMTSRLGDIFEIGKEYVVSPRRIYNTLWDFYFVSNYFHLIARDLLSDHDIERIRALGVTERDIATSEITTVENASTSRSFTSNVDLVAEITILESWADPLPDNTVFDVAFDIVDILKGEEHRAALSERDIIRLNFDVQVGETYLVMLEVFDGTSFLPAARNGAVVSERSRDFARYREAFAGAASE
jgi:hypothetical protein